MVSPAERHSKLIAHFQSDPAYLGVSEMVCIRRRPAADEARMPSDKFQMFFVAQAARFRESENALVDAGSSGTLSFRSSFALTARFRLRRRSMDIEGGHHLGRRGDTGMFVAPLSQRAQLLRERAFDFPGSLRG